MTDWVITLPQTVEWEDYQKELDFVEKEEGGSLWYRVAYPPKDLKRGDRVFLVWRGKVRGWMKSLNDGDYSMGFFCRVTDRYWPEGWYVVREGKFHKVDGPAMKGFRGIRRFRYYEEDAS